MYRGDVLAGRSALRGGRSCHVQAPASFAARHCTSGPMDYRVRCSYLITKGCKQHRRRSYLAIYSQKSQYCYSRVTLRLNIPALMRVRCTRPNRLRDAQRSMRIRVHRAHAYESNLVRRVFYRHIHMYKINQYKVEVEHLPMRRLLRHGVLPDHVSILLYTAAY